MILLYCESSIGLLCSVYYFVLPVLRAVLSNVFLLCSGQCSVMSLSRVQGSVQYSLSPVFRAVFSNVSLLCSGLPPTPVQLLYPVSRFSNIKSLQHLCRFRIRQLVRIDHIQELPLPKYASPHSGFTRTARGAVLLKHGNSLFFHCYATKSNIIII